jgi:hypothetical protein
MGQRVGRVCCESDPVAEVEWSPELRGQNRSRVAQAGAATVIKAESIIVESAPCAPEISYSQSEAGPADLSLSPTGFVLSGSQPKMGGTTGLVEALVPRYAAMRGGTGAFFLTFASKLPNNARRRAWEW